MKVRIGPNLVTVHLARSLLFCKFINATSYHLGRHEHSSSSTKELHVQTNQMFLKSSIKLLYHFTCAPIRYSKKCCTVLVPRGGGGPFTSQRSVALKCCESFCKYFEIDKGGWLLKEVFLFETFRDKTGFRGEGNRHKNVKYFLLCHWAVKNKGVSRKPW